MTYTIRLFLITLFLSASGILKAQVGAPTGSIWFVPLFNNCPGAVANFSVMGETGVSPVSYSWNFGDFTCSSPTNPNTKTGTSVSHQFNCSGWYTVTLTATNSVGTKTTTASVFIVTPSLPSITFSAAPCKGDVVDFFGSASIPAAVVSWAWSFGPTTQNTTHVFSSGGSHTVMLTVLDINGCNTTTARFINVCDPLPVQWISFTANEIEEQVLLKWATAFEKNNSHYDVQHSENAIDFKTIETVYSQGDRLAVTNYSFVHRHPSPGINYYRLIQNDLNGNQEISPIRSANAQEKELVIAPNPSSGQFNIQFNDITPTNISITDMSGIEIYKSKTHEGKCTFGEDFPQGTYVLRVITENDVKVYKIIKN